MKSKVDVFVEHLKKSVTDARIVVDPPAKTGGTVFLDVSFKRHVVTVQWHAQRGFGITCTRDPLYGEGPHEVFDNPKEAAGRAAKLLLSGGFTHPPSTAPIARLRMLRGLSQEELAKRLHVRQAAVSKLESKTDIKIDPPVTSRVS